MGSYEVSILDDSAMNIRKTFDKWLKKVDDSGEEGGLASYEGNLKDLLDVAKSGLTVLNQVKNVTKDPSDAIGGYFLGMIDPEGADATAKYQTDINIWQLSASGEKVYGYKLQNAFPQTVGIVTLDDGEENTLSEFSVTFAFSEFIPLENQSFGEELLRTTIGDSGNEVVNGVEALFD